MNEFLVIKEIFWAPFLVKWVDSEVTMTRPESNIRWPEFESSPLGQRTSIMEVILSLIIRKGIMILSHKNDELFQGEGAFKGLVSSESFLAWVQAMAMQLGQDCPNTDTQSVSCDPGPVCTDVAIIC